VAMVNWVLHLRSRHFFLFDAQMQNPHLARFGSYIIENHEYIRLLNQALDRACKFD